MRSLVGCVCSSPWATRTGVVQPRLVHQLLVSHPRAMGQQRYSSGASSTASSIPTSSASSLSSSSVVATMPLASLAATTFCAETCLNFQIKSKQRSPSLLEAVRLRRQRLKHQVQIFEILCATRVRRECGDQVVGFLATVMALAARQEKRECLPTWTFLVNYVLNVAQYFHPPTAQHHESTLFDPSFLNSLGSLLR